MCKKCLKLVINYKNLNLRLVDSKNKVVTVVEYIVKKARVYENSVLTKVDINVVIKLCVML
jgi:RNase P subunit RPR2